MGTVVIVLIVLGAVLLLGALGEVLFQRTGVPDLLFLMAAGLLLGPVLDLVQRDDLAVAAPHVATIALVFTVLEEGAKLKLSGGAAPSARSALLASLSFVSVIALVVPIAMIASVAGLLSSAFEVGHATVLAASLGCTAAVLSIPAIGKARIGSAVQGLLEGESELGSAFAVAIVALTLDAMSAKHDGALELMLSLLYAIPAGVAIGLVAGIAWLLFLRAVRSSDHAFGLTFAAALIVFATIRLAHADALLGVLAFAMVAANGDGISQRLRLGPSPVQATDGRAIRNGLALVIRGSLFMVAGMMMAPPWVGLGLGAAIALVMLGGRAPGVLAAARGTPDGAASRWLIAIAMPRGALSIALALAPIALALPAAADVASVAGASVFFAAVVFVGGVLVLQKVQPGALSPYASIEAAAAAPVSLIDSTARPAMELSATIISAPAGPQGDWESDSGPLSTRTPIPMPKPLPPPNPPRFRPAPPLGPPDRDVRPTQASEPAMEEVEVQEAPATPRRFPAPPVPPDRGSRGGMS